MKKRNSIIFIFLAIILMMSLFLGNTTKINVFAEKSTNNLNIESESSILVEPFSKAIVFSKNEKERLPIASMCKIMTLLLCFESIDKNEIHFDDKVVVSENAQNMGGSQVFLQANSEYLVNDLIKSIVVASANDASVAMSEYIAGSEENFVEQMNKKANELQMENTNFVNATGLPQSGQYSCALDVSIMFNELCKHRDYFRFSNIWMDEINHPENRVTGISNTNKLIRYYKGCDGGKTGYTNEAGHCLCATAFREGTRLIAVVIKSPDSKTRFKDVSNLFNYGFNNYSSKLVIDDRNPLNIDVKINGGTKDNLSVIAEKPFFVFTKKKEKISADIEYNINKNLKAPINKNDKVGVISIYNNGVCIEEINILSLENIAKKSYSDILDDICNQWAIK